MKPRHTFAPFLFVLFVSLAQLSAAAVIDFETTPSGAAPSDNAPLSAPYNIVGGGTVTFFFDSNGNNSYDPGTDVQPIFEAYGPDGSDGFSNGTLGLADTANGGLAGQLGNFFLRQLQPGTPPPPLIADYNTSQIISGLSGEIWDIDGGLAGTEQWLVEALDGSNNLLVSQLSPLGIGPALDGLPWVFSFPGLPSGFDKVRISFVGTKVSGLGLAFNNFDPTSSAAPEPGTLLLAVVAAGMLAAVARCRSRRVSKPAGGECCISPGSAS
jgi:hypothetical protein